MYIMATTYSTYEAKARFSEILRRVREGRSVTITYHGEVVAEIRPAYRVGQEQAMKQLEEHGLISPPEAPTGKLAPLACKPGALARFLESRD